MSDLYFFTGLSPVILFTVVFFIYLARLFMLASFYGKISEKGTSEALHNLPDFEEAAGRIFLWRFEKLLRPQMTVRINFKSIFTYYISKARRLIWR